MTDQDPRAEVKSLQLLSRILDVPESRDRLVHEFQELVWGTRGLLGGDATTDELLREAAYDLDFYEPDPRLAAEDPSYYGDARLEELVRSVLARLGSAMSPSEPD